MLWLLFISIIILFIIVIILSLRITMKVHYAWYRNEQQLQLSGFLGKIRIVDKKIPIRTMDDSLEQLDDNLDLQLNSMMKTAKKGLQVMRNILSHTRLHQLEWSTSIGTGDASSTGVASGMLWTVKSMITGYFLEKLILRCDPTIQVAPNFEQMDFQTTLDCMVSIRIGKAIQGLMQINRLVKLK